MTPLMKRLLTSPARSSVHLIIASLLAVLASTTLPTSTAANAPASTAENPVELVRETAGEILNKLQANRETYTQDPQMLREMVREDLLPLIDLEYSARLILGKAGRDVSQEQLEAFADTMADVLVDRYAGGLLEFRSDEQFQVLPVSGGNERLTRVRTRVELEQGGSAPVDYAFRKTDEGWKAFDVTVEGISYVITFRNQIVPQVESKGIEQVTEEIRAGNLELNVEQ